MINAGVKFVKFAPADGQKFIDTAYAAQWDKMMKIQPEIAAKLRGMLSK